MFKVKRKLGGFAASWHDGTEFIDPCPFRAIELAADDAMNRLDRSLAEVRERVRESRETVQGREVFMLDEIETVELDGAGVGIVAGGGA